MIQNNSPSDVSKEPSRLLRPIAIILVLLGVLMLGFLFYSHVAIYRKTVESLEKSIGENKKRIESVSRIAGGTPPRKIDPKTGGENPAFERYRKAREIKRLSELGLARDREKLERIRPFGYEIYFAVIDVMLIIGGVGLLLLRKWGQRIVLAALMLFPLYVAYYVWVTVTRLENIPKKYYGLGLVVIPVAWLFWYLLAKPVRESLLPKRAAATEQDKVDDAAD